MVQCMESGDIRICFLRHSLSWELPASAGEQCLGARAAAGYRGGVLMGPEFCGSGVKGSRRDGDATGWK